MIALVTGGAGFIGSHLVDALVARGDEVRIIDDLFSGSRDNVHPDAHLTVGSVADAEVLAGVMPGVEVVFHLAAIGAVARSVDNPLPTDLVNVHGTVAVLTAARDAGVRRLVFASSSSVYGGLAQPPTPETAPLRPKSPYAVSKLAGEEYLRVFSELFDLETVALRFFNVFGPRQRPDSLYAAVIPLFINALLEGRRPLVHGDGMQSRDFTFVADVVAAVTGAAGADADAVNGQVFNIAGGWTHTLLDLLGHLGNIIGVDADPEFGPARAGDVRLSQADAGKVRAAYGFECTVPFEEGLRQTVEWARRRAGD